MKNETKQTVYQSIEPTNDCGTSRLNIYSHPADKAARLARSGGIDDSLSPLHLDVVAR